MNTYEAMILLDNREVKKGWDPLKEQVDGVLSKHGADIVVAKRWDERKLAYEIKRQRRATYYLTYFKADPDAITGITHGLRLTQPVLRSMILRCEEIPAAAYEPEREFDIDRSDESKSDESKSDESKSDESKGDESKSDEPKGEESKSDEPKSEEGASDESAEASATASEESSEGAATSDSEASADTTDETTEPPAAESTEEEKE